ncbi:hypothetical protein ACQ4LE_004853 [Meloidogyne hapla]
MERTTDQMKGMTFMLMLLMFFISMDCAPTPEKEVILARRSDLFPCPNCEEWCKNDPKYICKYSCEVDFDKSPELNKPCEEYNKFKNKTCIYQSFYYPLCSLDFKPYTEGGEKCCQTVKECQVDYEYALITEKCAPTAHQNPTDKYMMVFSARYYGKTTKKSWVMSSSFDIRASTHHKTFLESCGLTCGANGRLKQKKIPCPNCFDWCKNDPSYTCEYSCSRKVETENYVVSGYPLFTKLFYVIHRTPEYVYGYNKMFDGFRECWGRQLSRCKNRYSCTDEEKTTLTITSQCAEGFSSDKGYPKIRLHEIGSKGVWVCEDIKTCNLIYKWAKLFCVDDRLYYERDIKHEMTSNTFPCPNCAEWCKYLPEYKCSYSCKYNYAVLPDYKQLTTIDFTTNYPLCTYDDYKPIEYGLNRCCEWIEDCTNVQKKNDKIPYQIEINEECAPAWKNIKNLDIHFDKLKHFWYCYADEFWCYTFIRRCRMDCINDKLVYNAAHHSLAIQDQADYIQKRLEEAENQIRKNAIDIALLQRRITKIEYDLKTAEEKAALKSACNMEFDKDNYVKHKEEEISSIVIDVVKYGGMFLTGLGCTVATVNPAVGAGCAAATGLAIEGIVKSGKLICEYVNEV